MAALAAPQLAAFVLCSISLPFGVILLLAHVVAFFETDYEKTKSAESAMSQSLFASCLFYVVFVVLILGNFAFNWLADPQSCYFLETYVAIFYVLTKQSQNLFLFSRAKLVHDAMQLNSFGAILFRWTVWLMATVGVWIVFGWNFWLNYYGIVAPDGICLFDSHWPVVIIVFAGVDALLSAAMLGMFVLPLYHFTQEHTHITSASSNLRNTIRRNLIVSVLVILFGFLSLLQLAIIHALTADIGGLALDERSLMLAMAVIVPLIDPLVGSIALHTLTKSWMPRFLRLWLDRMIGTSSSATLNAQRTLASIEGMLGSVAERRPVLIRRAGSDGAIVSDVGLSSDLQNAELLDDSGGDVVSVATRHVIAAKEFDTALASRFPKTARSVHAVFSRKFRYRRAFLALLHVLTIVFVFIMPPLVFANVLPSYVAIVEGALGLIVVFFSWTASLNRKLLVHVISTRFFATRFTSALVSTAALIATAPDFSPIWLCYFFIQCYAALGDAYTGSFQGYRSFMLILQFEALMGILIVVMGDFWTLPNHFAISLPGTTFDYSLIQLVRDLYLGTLVVGCFDFYFALFKTKKRFAHLHYPVEFVILPLEEVEASTGHSTSRALPQRFAPVSMLVVRSGFLMHQPHQGSTGQHGAENNTKDSSTIPAPASNPLRVFVDTVALKKNDAIVFHLCSTAVAKIVLMSLEGTAAIVLETCSEALFVSALIGTPFFPTRSMSLLAAPYPIVFAVRHWLLQSLVMTRLLLKLRKMYVEIVFLLAWFALSITIYNYEVIAIQVALFVVVLTDLFRDALLINSSWLHRAFENLRLGIYFAILSGYMIWHQYFFPVDYFVDFNPSTAVARGKLNWTTSTYSDGQSVVDIYQTCVDLTMTLALGFFLSAFSLALKRKSNELDMFFIPVVPVFEE